MLSSPLDMDVANLVLSKKCLLECRLPGLPSTFETMDDEPWASELPNRTDFGAVASAKVWRKVRWEVAPRRA